MQIQSNFNSKTNFNGIHVAKATNVVDGLKTTIDIYKMTPKDDRFLMQLRSSKKMIDLMPDNKITTQQYNRWQFLFEYVISQSFHRGEQSYLAAVNKKPCGIISFKPTENKFDLDCICTWPAEIGKKVKMAGQTLFKQMFEDFQNSPAKIINLTAITDGPYSTVSKYMKLGFKQTGGEDGLVTMRTNREAVEKTLEKLNENIKTTSISDGKDENLFEILSLEND